MIGRCVAVKKRLSWRGCYRRNGGGQRSRWRLGQESVVQNDQRDHEIDDQPGHVDQRRDERGRRGGGIEPEAAQKKGSMLPTSEPKVTTPMRLTQTVRPIR